MKVVNDHDSIENSSIDEEIFLLDQDINKLQVNGLPNHKRYRKKVSESGNVSAPVSPRQNRKCGRPANPIPRHKRDSHIKAEHKRRDKIQKGFDTLREIVPALEECSPKESKASMLLKTAEHCRHLKAECKTRQDLASVLRQEIEALGSDIHKLQRRLPAAGLVKQEIKPVSMDAMYEKYVCESTENNWKFWIFSFIMDPLFSAYKTVTEKCQADSFFHTVQRWAEEHLSLVNLRPGILSSLTNVIKKTDIMDKPEILPHQAMKAVRHRRFSGENTPPNPVASCYVTPAVSPKSGAHSPCIPASPVNHSPRIPSSSVESTPLKMLPTSPTELQPLQDMIASMDTWQSSSLPAVNESLLVDTDSTCLPIMDMQTSHSAISTLTSQSVSSQSTAMEFQAATSLPMLHCPTTQALATELEMSDSLLDTFTSQVDMQLPDLGHILSDNLYTSAPSSFESVFTTAQSSISSIDHDQISSISVFSNSDALISCVSTDSKTRQGKLL